ncbi:unnamed protein product [Adineta steineri]|uniref:Nuclear receptor domain-containing protein n=1 Tax=Adineta steineri TaxID=433720 RepID=A0A813Z121_9BILA|nr:unnamed protein product [Adineta steineri]
MTSRIHYCGQKSPNSTNRCVICGSKSIGINFGVLTCAPCKAFFRRNARRKELLELPCRYRDFSALMVNNHAMNERTMRYLQIRRCSSCRLRRCFDMGMKEELVRTEEENERHKQLVDLNRKRRDLLKQQLLEIKELSTPQLFELPCRYRDLSASMINNHEMNERTMRYLQIRRCSSCRLRRCFHVGMKEDLVRTDEENERHKQLIDLNRKRRDLLKQQLLEIKELSIPQNILGDNYLSNDIDWRHLSNIVYAYESCCIKTYLRQRSSVIFNRTTQSSNEQPYNIYPTTITMSIVLAVSSFLKTLPAYYSLPRSTRKYLCKTNIRPLIFPNLHELNQSCYAEPWQVNAYNKTWQLVCGAQLYEEFDKAERMAEKSWTTDPIVARLFIIILFFSTPLHYHDDSPTPTKILKKKQAILQTQNGYITLLWKYLTHRYGSEGSVRIYLNLVHVYMKMQEVGYGMYMQLTTQKDLVPTHETLSKLVTLDINDTQ